MFYPRSVLVVSALALSGFAAPLSSRQDQNQGQPVSVGVHADRSAPASSIFGTTSDQPNFTTLPTGLCIVPQYTNQAGIGGPQKELTVQNALELCPRAQRIVVSTPN
ncbi:unnamed protein product [Rhizoctonia solani]|uniref:Uncharacterized protein n=1 Tax=Rhizoctonia solani TaxID=456999 RepID=A0A8H3HAI9_9AGAM|nr:unnamed protein product [Rhizoctonia solani]